MWYYGTVTVDLFNQGMRPVEVTQHVEISLRTAHRYFADWKKLPKNLLRRYLLLRRGLKKNTEFSDTIIEQLAKDLEMRKDGVILRLQRPWGLAQLLKGHGPDYRRERIYRKQEARLAAAIRIIRFAEFCGMAPEKVEAVVHGLM